MKSFFATALLSAVALQMAHAQELDCTLPDAVDISTAGDGSMLLRHVIHPVDETVTMELEWAGATGYLSIGFSATGAMVPAHAVIGLPDTGDVQKYDMVGKGLTDVIPVADNALTATSIEQTDTTTILRFTQPLNDGVDPVVVASDATNLVVIWAYGITNDFGMHANRGTFFLTSPIPECTAAAVEAPVVETSAPSVAQVVAATSEPTVAAVEATLFPVAAPEEAAQPEEPAAPAPSKPTAPTPASAPTPRAAATPTARTNSTDAAGNAPTPAGSMFVPTARDNTTNVETEAPAQENVTATDAPEDIAMPSASSGTFDCSPQADPLDMSVAQDGSLLLKQFIVHPGEQTVTIEVEWVGEAYLSLGFSKDGLMVPKVAIIGLPDTGDVQKYDMTGRTMETVTLSSAEQQTLTNASITQVDGITTLKYTKPLIDDGDEDVIPGASTRVIWAYGFTNALGMHAARGFADFALQTCLEVGTTAPPTTQSPTVTPTAPPPTVSPTVATTRSPTAPISSNATFNCDPQAEALDMSVAKDGSLLLKQFIVHPVEQTVTVEVEWVGEAYLSLGFSKDGLMVPKVAIIGLPGNETETGDVQKYDMTGRTMETVTLSPTAQQTLTNATITQVDGITTLKYTKPLIDEGDEDVVPGASTRVIWAYGFTNALGGHPARGFADFKLQTCLEEGMTVAPTVTPVETTPPTAMPAAAAVVPEGAVVDLGNGRIQRFIAVEKDKSEFTIVTDTVAGTITVDMVYEGLGYVSFGIGSTLYMPNAISVVASPEINGGVPVKYDLGPTKAMSDVTLSPLQTLTNASCIQNETHTRMIFTKLMVEGPEPAVDMLGETPFLYAMGPGNTFGMHIIGSSFAIDLASLDSTIKEGTSPNKTLWMIHGILLGLAWAILVPLGVAASILRGLFTDTTGLWFKSHKNLNSLAVAFTVVGFAIAVYLISDEQEGAKHFQTMNHHKTGLVVFLFALLQALSGIFRPPGPHKPAPKEEDDVKSTYSEAFEDDDLKKGNIDKAKEGPKDDPDDHHDDHDHSKKSGARIAFEIQHRVMGMACMILGWVTCATGIEAYNVRFDGIDFMGVMWGIVAGISIVTLILAVFQKVRSGP